MFWDKGYAPSANIEALLEKENATVEEFLDEEDILQECKTQKKNIVNYFTRPEIIKRLVELITTEPSEELPIAQRFRYANMACEILTVGLPSLDEKLLSDADILKCLYSYLEKEPPLNPLLSSFFSKTFSMLFTKKAETDWFLYQQMCLQLLEYLKAQKNFLELVCKHFDTPVIPDLIMHMMKDVEGGQLKRNLFEWLTEDKLVERLIDILRNPQETDKHANVAEFFCDLIHQGRLMRQTEQENDSFEPAFECSNPILKNIESNETIEALLNVILEPNAQESSILSGISVVLTLIKPITFTDEPNSDRQKHLQKRERLMHVQVQETVINVIAPRLKEFVELLKNPINKPLNETNLSTPPFGKTRLQIARIFTALLETKHEIVSKAVIDTEYFNLMLDFFKQYCWNNFLHTEVEKGVDLVFYMDFSNATNNNNLNSTISNDNTRPTNTNNNTNIDINTNSNSNVNYNKIDLNNYPYETQMPADDFVFNYFMAQTDENTKKINVLENGSQRAEGGEDQSKEAVESQLNGEKMEIEEQLVTEMETNASKNVLDNENCENKSASDGDDFLSKETTENLQLDAEMKDLENAKEIEQNAINSENKQNEANMNSLEDNDVNGVQQIGTSSENPLNVTDTPNNLLPSELQKHLIVDCKIVPKLVDCWQYNNEAQFGEKGRRLGFMGHLIKIIKHVTNCMSESQHISALVESNFNSETELKLWRSIIDPQDGEFIKAINTQAKLLANSSPHVDMVEFNSIVAHSYNFLDSINVNDIVFTLDDDQNTFQFGRSLDDDDDDEDENSAAGGGDGNSSLYSKGGLSLNSFSSSPWNMDDPFGDMNTSSSGAGIGLGHGGNAADDNATTWGTEFGSDNFADFDAHFSSFTNDLGLANSPMKAKDANIISLNQTIKDHELDRDEHDDNESSSCEDNEAVENNDQSTEEQRQQDVENFMQDQNSSEDGEIIAAEYDKNANVEKTNTYFGENVSKDTEIFSSTTLVSRLQQVLLDGEEDYEEDDGVWTKPLGGSSSSENTDADQIEKVEAKNEVLTNGPSSMQQTLLNSEIEKGIRADTGSGAEKEFYRAEAMQDQQQDQHQDLHQDEQHQSSLEQKIAANTTNNTEIAPTTT